MIEIGKLGIDSSATLSDILKRMKKRGSRKSRYLLIKFGCRVRGLFEFRMEARVHNEAKICHVTRYDEKITKKYTPLILFYAKIKKIYTLTL